MDIPKVEAVSKEIKKRRLSEIGMNEYEEGCEELDLELKLSLPGSGSGDLPNGLKLGTSRTPLSLSSSSSQGAWLTSRMDIDKNVDGNSKDEVPPLIAMGCAFCLIYVMVSKANPKCPLCTNSDLIKFQVNPTKKMRTSWY